MNTESSLKDIKSTLIRFIIQNYQPDIISVPHKKDSNIEARYRRGGKTICTIESNESSLKVLIVLGQKEVDAVKKSLKSFSPVIQETFLKAKQYHDGRWLFIEIKEPALEKDIEKLLLIKHRPLIKAKSVK